MDENFREDVIKSQVGEEERTKGKCGQGSRGKDEAYPQSTFVKAT